MHPVVGARHARRPAGAIIGEQGDGKRYGARCGLGGTCRHSQRLSWRECSASATRRTRARPPAHRGAVHCDQHASDEEVYEALQRAYRAARGGLDTAQAARTISISSTRPGGEQLATTPGAPGVGRRPGGAGDPAPLRENTSADITCCEISVMGGAGRQHTVEETITLLPVLREFDVPLSTATSPRALARVPTAG